ncbi:hypothetical protein BDF19DRAFT_55600 [Syncephalis fuscata]|nr:hypothetical protein BDF19DRAFT_55600 [Syncephalis fuscata]
MSLGTHSEHFWQNHDTLLYLCRFMEGKKLVLFATCCRHIYKIIVDQPDYWERQYRQKFCLGDRREQDWLTWYNLDINPTSELEKSTLSVNQAGRVHLLLSAVATVDNADNEYTAANSHLPLAPNFETTKWFYAYQRRRQTNRNFMMGRFKKRTCQLPTSEHAQAALRSVNPWYALRGNRDAPELWLIWHNIFNKKNGHNKEELTWKKLTMPSAPLLFCKKVSFSIFYGTRRFVVGNVFIYTYSDVKLIDIGEPVTNVAEMEAQYIKENKSKVSNALDEHSTGSSATTPSTKREFKKRRALLCGLLLAIHHLISFILTPKLGIEKE